MTNFRAGIQNYKRRSQKEKEASLLRFKNLITKYMRKDLAKTLIDIVGKDKERFLSSPGSNDKHQPWEGGYMDHIAQLMNYAIKNYDLKQIKLLPKHEQYSLSDVLLIIFLHDIEKPWKYFEPKTKMKYEYSLYYKNISEARKDKTNNPVESKRECVKLEKGEIYFPSEKEIFAKNNNIKLEVKHQIALHYVHGELYGSYDKSLRRQSPLGAAVGNADRYSARVLFNQGFDIKGKIIKYTGPNLEGENVGTLADIKSYNFGNAKIN